MYHRIHLEPGPAPEIIPFPNRTRVRVSKPRLALHLLQQLVRHWRHPAVATSRPCIFGVFSGPVGGFAPRGSLCMGCLRCTVEYPEMTRVYLNPERSHLGDSYFTPDLLDTIHYEARTGRIPVKGAGYRGPFGGRGWDGMWTDMSEIVRPTRDGIHGREFISTAVDIGEKPPFLIFGDHGALAEPSPPILSIPIPFLFDAPPASLISERLLKILAAAAQEAGTFLILPFAALNRYAVWGPQVVPLVRMEDRDALSELRDPPPMIELDGWNEALFQPVRARFPDTVICLRDGFLAKDKLLERFRAGVRVFHLVADYHGIGGDGRFVLDLIREAHRGLVEAGCRDQATLLGSGGITAGEHVPKAIICGLDAVALDTPLLAALQARFVGECASRATARFRLPGELPADWGVRRVLNLVGSWRDQLLEVLGAMGLREVRRLRGELGRAMFQQDLEREAFSGIEGYDG